MVEQSPPSAHPAEEHYATFEESTQKKNGITTYVTSAWTKIRAFIIESKRVLKVTKKPARDEFKTIVKISGLGIGLVGFIGFLVHLIKELLF